MVRLVAVLLCAAVLVGAAGPDAFGELSTGTTARDHARYQAAVRYYSRVIAWPGVSKINMGNVHYNRANALYYLGHHVRAIEDYAVALRFSPDNADVHYNRANAYAGLGSHDQAITDFSQAIRLDPGHHYAYYNRGNSYLSLGDFQRATKDFKKAYVLDPDDLIYQDTMKEFGLSQ
jgi:tetratricopeptide (TPR) repeat protein